MIFPFYYMDVVNYVDGFSNVKQILRLRNKGLWVIMYDPFSKFFEISNIYFDIKY